MRLLKIIKILVNSVAGLFIIYFVTALFLITDVECDFFWEMILRAIKFHSQLFLLVFIVTTVLNIIIERKIDKLNFVKNVIKLQLLQFSIFISFFILNSFYYYFSKC